MALTKKQLDHIEKRLLDERARALKALGLFDEMAKADRESGDSDLSAYTDHMADQGTEAMEREKAAAFATKEGRYLYRLEEALGRLYNDPKAFGTCHTCGSTRSPGMPCRSPWTQPAPALPPMTSAAAVKGLLHG